MNQLVAMRAVGVRNADHSWYGAIEASRAEGYVWACLHEHPSLAEARACAEHRLALHVERGGPWSGPDAPSYRTRSGLGA